MHPNAIMYVWRKGDQEAWQCSECIRIGLEKAPTVCPDCQRPVLANVVYGERRREMGKWRGLDEPDKWGNYVDTYNPNSPGHWVLTNDGEPDANGNVAYWAKLPPRSVRMNSDGVVRGSEEVRVIDPKTGGEKGTKLARFSLIPPEFTWALAEHYGRGARKYEDKNWERGYKWSLSLDALQRHLHQWLRGEDNDGETGTHHLICVAWHACALFIYQLRGLGTDDVRVKAPSTQLPSQQESL